MKGITIYFEGGGGTASSKRKLRQGMDVFLEDLKSAARAKSLPYKIVACGDRNQTYRAFRHACRGDDETAAVLLVDSEESVSGNTTSLVHLHKRDRWDLSGIAEEVVHLMIQSMETWIVSDPDALAQYYGRNFRQGILPNLPNIESRSKVEIARLLIRATESTNKNRYHKIKHARHLLQRIDPRKVREHCPSCNRLFVEVGKIIASH